MFILYLSYKKINRFIIINLTLSSSFYFVIKILIPIGRFLIMASKYNYGVVEIQLWRRRNTIMASQKYNYGVVEIKLSLVENLQTD